MCYRNLRWRQVLYVSQFQLTYLHPSTVFTPFNQQGGIKGKNEQYCQLCLNINNGRIQQLQYNSLGSANTVITLTTKIKTVACSAKWLEADFCKEILH